MEDTFKPFHQSRTKFSEIFDGQEFLPGPELPFTAWDSCVVEYEPGVVFITGGFTAERPAYLLEVDTGDMGLRLINCNQ